MSFTPDPCNEGAAYAQLTGNQVEAWQRCYRVSHGSARESELVHEYLPLVKSVAGRIAMALPPHIRMEDLHSAGMVGLLSAIRNFDPNTNPVFETYARLRIRGAVLDELRRMDWAPRSVHVKARQVEAVMRRLEQAKGRIPTEQEMATGLNISVADYEKLLEEIHPAIFVHLDAPSRQCPEDRFAQNEIVADERQENPSERASRRELARLIVERLEQLPEMHRKVLALYYFEDLRLREIAEVFGVTESRICQIHSKALLSIRTWLQKMDTCPV
jgi:RNA polymerase sigma factor for flagellar operon FliA